MTVKHHIFLACLVILAVCAGNSGASLAAENSLVISLNRAELVTLPNEMGEVMVSDPNVADVHVHNATSLSIIGRSLGSTNIRILDKNSALLRSIDVQVSQDLPAIRKTMSRLLPGEKIGVESVNSNIALTGEISSASVADKALRIVNEYVKSSGGSESGAQAGSGVINLMQVTSSQQVMLRVRVGEIQRSALKNLGIDLSAIKNIGGTAVNVATGGSVGLPFGEAATAQGAFGVIGGTYQNSSGEGLSGTLQALERDGLFRVLAEPNLVALSGEQAEFLAGGEFPVPVSQDNSVTIEYRPFGVAVNFVPYVLSENRIRVVVQPEVSELSDAGSIQLNGFNVPSLTTRRARTTVELAPGESFMIAGLIRDQVNNTIDQIPGAKELPVLGALFRSTAFQRNETELVISVTPYIVDPLKSGDVKLPTDNFRTASFMESIFYGALGSLSGDARRISQTPSLEGPIGFMVD